MRRARLALATGVAAGVLFGAAPAATAVPAPDGSKHCGIMAKGDRDYRVKARGLKCRFARRWVKRYFRRGKVADGFKLIKTDGGKAPWYCTKGNKAYWPEKL